VSGVRGCATEATAALAPDHRTWSRDELAQVCHPSRRVVRGEVRAAADEAGGALLIQIRDEVARAEQAGRAAVRVDWMTGAVGAVALAGCAGFLLAGFGHG